MSIEKELLEVTGFKPRKEYDDRQDYLAALARAVDALKPDDFDNLTNEATEWFNKAAEALNDKDALPDFEDASNGADPEAEGDPTEDNEPEPEGEEGDEEPVDPETGEVLEKPAPKPKKAKKEKPEKVSAKAPKKGREPPKKLPHPPITLLKETGVVFDEFGVAKGTKNAAAVEMLQKGCRMNDITETLGGTYYNLLRRLVREGHHLEKSGNGVLTLIHKDGEVKSAKSKK